MRAIVLGTAVFLAAVVAGSALGAGNSPAKSVYDTHGTKVQHVLGAAHKATSHKPSSPSGTLAAKATTKAAPATASSPGSDLPFTGLDLGFIVGAGALLAAIGFSLRRMGRKSPPLT
jgi:hypothetical protein